MHKKLIPPAITPGKWGKDEPGFIRLEEQIDCLKAGIGTPDEWEPVCILDDEGISESVVALCHPMNSVAIAAIPAVISAAARALAILDAKAERDGKRNWNAETRKELRAALLAAGYTEAPES